MAQLAAVSQFATILIVCDTPSTLTIKFLFTILKSWAVKEVPANVPEDAAAPPPTAALPSTVTGLFVLHRFKMPQLETGSLQKFLPEMVN